MIRKLIAAAALSAALVAAPTLAAPCKDAKGKFIKCPPAAPAPAPKSATPAPAAAGITKDKNGRCHVASGPKKGQFTKCN